MQTTSYQTNNLPNEHFARRTFYQTNILSVKHFTRQTFYQIGRQTNLWPKRHPTILPDKQITSQTEQNILPVRHTTKYFTRQIKILLVKQTYNQYTRQTDRQTTKNFTRQTNILPVRQTIFSPGRQFFLSNRQTIFLPDKQPIYQTFSPILPDRQTIFLPGRQPMYQTFTHFTKQTVILPDRQTNRFFARQTFNDSTTQTDK